jgi:hypothetical protein
VITSGSPARRVTPAVGDHDLEGPAPIDHEKGEPTTPDEYIMLNRHRVKFTARELGGAQPRRSVTTHHGSNVVGFAVTRQPPRAALLHDGDCRATGRDASIRHRTPVQQVSEPHSRLLDRVLGPHEMRLDRGWQWTAVLMC